MSSFKPSASGWPFANVFDHPAEHLGLSGRVAPGFGLCGGMCWSALDRHMSGIPISRDIDAPASGEPLYAELVRRQANVLAHGVWDRVRAWHELPDEGRTLGGDGVADLTRKEWTQIRTRLDEDVPVLLCLVRSRGIYSDPTTSHQVLAYGYDLLGERVELHVYDPNQPGDDDFRLIFHLGRKGTPLDALMTDGRPVRGFFSIPYDRRRTPDFAGDRFDDRARIALNRPVDGRPFILKGSGGRLDLFVAAPDRSLLHFQRKPGQHWSGTNLTAEDRIGAEFAVHGDPVAVGLAGKRISVFVRGEFGDLLHYQWKLRWSAENLTDKRKAGPRYRLESQPVVLDEAGLRLSVFGRSGAGHLIQYSWAPVQGWSADDVTENSRSGANHIISGRPAALLGPEGAHHVIGRNDEGQIVHYLRLSGEHWDADNVTSGLPDQARLRIVDDPVAHCAENGLEVYGRNGDGQLVVYRWTTGGGWEATSLEGPDGVGAANAPSLAVTGQERHLFARAGSGELLHWYRDGGLWRAENVSERARIGGGLRMDGPPQAVLAEAGSMYVFGRSGREVILYRWTARADWEADVLTRRDGFGPEYRVDDPLIAGLDTLDAPHVLSADRKGTVVHFELVTEARPAGGAPPAPVEEAEAPAIQHVPEAELAEEPEEAATDEPEEAGTITLSAAELLAEDDEAATLLTEDDDAGSTGAHPEETEEADDAVPVAETDTAATTTSGRGKSRRPAALEGLPLLEDLPWEHGGTEDAEDTEDAEEDAAFALPLLFDPDEDAEGAPEPAPGEIVAGSGSPEPEGAGTARSAETDPLAFLDELPGDEPGGAGAEAGDAVAGAEDDDRAEEPVANEPPLARLGDLQILAEAVDEARGPLERIDDVQILPELLLEPDVVSEPEEESREVAEGVEPAAPTRLSYDHASADVVPDDLAYSFDLPDDLGQELGLQIPETSLQFLSTQMDDEADSGPGCNGSELVKDPEFMEHSASSWPQVRQPYGAAPLPHLGDLRELSEDSVDNTNPTKRNVDGEDRAAKPPPPLLQMRDFEQDG